MEYFKAAKDAFNKLKVDPQKNYLSGLKNQSILEKNNFLKM